MTKQNKAVIKTATVEFRYDDDGESSYVVLLDRTIIARCATGEIAHAIAHALNSQGKLIEACEAAVTDAEKAVNPESRLWNYAQMKSAIQGAKGG